MILHHGATWVHQTAPCLGYHPLWDTRDTPWALVGLWQQNAWGLARVLEAPGVSRRVPSTPGTDVRGGGKPGWRFPFPIAVCCGKGERFCEGHGGIGFLS